MTFFVCIVLAILAAAYFVKPLFHSDPVYDNLPSQSQIALQDEKERYLQMIKDLELDFRTGKIAQDEFESTREQFVSELARIMQMQKA
jgi:hypothetical protein